MNQNKIKGIISTVLIIAALLSYSTGAVLYFLQQGMWLIFTRKFIKDIHLISTIIMGLAIIIHLYLNRKIYKSEIKSVFNINDK